MNRIDKCPRCLGPVFAVEYDYTNPEHYDGTSEYMCQDFEKCKWRIGRWCGRELQQGEIETRYCNGGQHKRILGHHDETIQETEAIVGKKD